MAETVGLAFIGLPAPLMDVDAWAVIGERSIIWSPGA